MTLAARHGLTLEVSADPAPADVAVIETNLIAYNVAAHGLADDSRPLCVFVRDASKALVGGVTASTRWGWLSLDCFWLPEAWRKDGLGTEVLASAEAEALRRGCTRSRLWTYSFQAQGFYEKHGYRIFGVLEDYPPGHRQFWMRKDLTAPA